MYKRQGQKRRVAVAGVMAMKPRILVLDEPAAGLDPEGRDDILSEVKEYHKKTGTTVLLVSHSMEDIAKYANRVLVMSNKKIAMYDTVLAVYEDCAVVYGADGGERGRFDLGGGSLVSVSQDLSLIHI